MTLSRRKFLSGSAGLLSSIGLAHLLPPASGATPVATVTLPPMTLRGYGTLTATFKLLFTGAASLTHIVCESPQKALLVQAKYLSDLGLLPGTSESSVIIAGLAIPTRLTSIGGIVTCFARHNDVLILAAASEEQLKASAATSLPQALVASEFSSRVAVPMWLDRWDKHGLMAYYGPGQVPPNMPNDGSEYDVNIDFQFAKDHGDIGLVLWTNALTVDTAEGMTNEQTWTYMQERAKQLGLPMHINLQNSWPVVWLSNRYREETELKAPQFLGGFYGVAHDSAPGGTLGWNSQAGEDALLGVLQETVRRFNPDSNVVGWLEPHAESADMPQGHFMEYGPFTDQSMRQYLQERYGSLAAVSQRWHGRVGHLKSWNEIHAPEIAEFAGYGPDAIDLRGMWRVKYVPKPDGKPSASASAPPEWFQPDFDDSGWDAFLAPGNDRMLSIPRSPLIYRRTIDVSAHWLATHPQVTMYVWDMFSIGDKPTDVYVNGQKIQEQSRSGNIFHWAIYDVTKALQPGSNHLALNLPHGIICYRTYFTGEKPAQYPLLGPTRNAKWADYNHWFLWYRKAQMARGVEMIRQVDPNRSINMMAVEYVAPFKSIAQEYGCRFHDTGAMAGFWTDEPSLMMAGMGFPTSAEPGSPAPDAAQFQAFFGRWITEGVNAVHYFQTLGDIEWNPEALKTFIANERMYHAIGKYHVPSPEVGILFSTVCQQLAGFPWDADASDQLGRSDYYHGPNPSYALMDYCPRGGISEDDFGTSTVDKFRVIIDCNTMFMSEKLVDGIETYVRNGGVFVTNGQTGRHDEVHPNTWPISRLTGYQVLQTHIHSHSVAAPGQTVLTGSEWTNPRDNDGQSLKKVAPECQDLLVWDDGTTAIGMRPLGKGWVVNVASGGDNSTVFRQVVAHFGVKRIPATYTPSPGLHFRHFIGNSGLQDIWVLFNESPNPVTTSLTFQTGVHPSSLTDLLTGADIPITHDAAGDSAQNISLHPWQTVMYVSPRADVAASPLEWLNLQQGWWQGTKKPPVKRLPRPEEMQHFTLDLTDGWAFKQVNDATDDQATALTQPGLDDHTWERRILDQWLDPGPPKPQRIILRRTFTVPAHWNAGTVLLCNHIPGGAFVPAARMFLEGKPMFTDRWFSNGPMYETLGGILKPGTTHHVAYDLKSPSTLIGVRSPCWLMYIPDPLGRQNLSGEWTGYANEFHQTEAVQLPGVAKNVQFVSRRVMIDAAHQGRNVIAYAVTDGEMFRGVLVNGSRIDVTAVGYERHYLSLNITPLVRFGEENLIEFTMRATPEGTPVHTVELRYYEKGFYP